MEMENVSVCLRQCLHVIEIIGYYSQMREKSCIQLFLKCVQTFSALNRFKGNQCYIFLFLTLIIFHCSQKGKKTGSVQVHKSPMRGQHLGNIPYDYKCHPYSGGWLHSCVHRNILDMEMQIVTIHHIHLKSIQCLINLPSQHLFQGDFKIEEKQIEANWDKRAKRKKNEVAEIELFTF